MKLTILMLVDQLNVGGTETHVLSLAKELVRQGIEVIIGSSGGPLLHIFEHSGLEVVYLPFQSDDPVAQEYQDLLVKTKELVTVRKVDLIHAHFIAGLKVAVQVSQELLVPAVVTIHGTFYPTRRLRGLLDRCSRVIAVSFPVVEWLSRKVDYPAKQITMIPNGIETDYFVPNASERRFRDELEIGEEDKLIVLVSRLAWGKTRVVETAIQAAAALHQEFPIYLGIVGSGPHTSLVHASAVLANRMVNKDMVKVLGWRLNTRDCYQGADVVIGTARVALEALSCGRPVVAGGNASYVGFLEPNSLEQAWEVYFGDHKWAQPLSAEKLAYDLRYVLLNPAVVSQQGEVCRDWVVENFHIGDMANRTIDLYKAVVTVGETAQTPTISVPKAASEILRKVTVVQRSQSPAAVRQPLDPQLLAQKPLVSVAIPAYNRGCFLKDCLHSAAGQTYRPIEIVLVNDGSTDDTEEVALEWWETLEDQRGMMFVYQRLPHNAGYAAAQSIAYHLSSGEFIANQDSDDVSHPRRLETELLFLLANSDYSFVGCNFHSFQDDLEKTKPNHMLRYGYENILSTYQDGGHCICFGTLLFRRSVFQRLGGLTTFLTGAEDYEWISRALNQGFYVDNISDVLYFYREHPHQLSRIHRTLREKLENLGRGKKG